MEKSIMLKVHCDECGDEMFVKRERFMHPNCVLALCDLCISETNKNKEIEYNTSHHVIGINAEGLKDRILIDAKREDLSHETRVHLYELVKDIIYLQM